MTFVRGRVHFIFLLAAIFFIIGIADAAVDLGSNLVSNPGFDADTAGWTMGSGTVRVTGTAHSGTGSVKLNANATPTYLSANLQSLAGRQVLVSVWARTTGANADSGGAVAEIKCLNSASKAIGYRRSRAVATNNGWQEIKMTVRVPISTASMRITLLNTSTTDTVWFDDISCKFPNEILFRTLIREPNYRQTIYSGQSRKITVGAEVFSSDAVPASSMAVKAELLDSAQKVISSTLPKEVMNKSWQNLGIMVPENTNGEFSVRTSLIDKTTKSVLKQTSHKVTISENALPKVYFDDKNRCIANGVAFFPIGIYGDKTSIEELDRLKDCGINVVMDYSMLARSLTEQTDFLNALNERGMKGIFSLKDCYEPLYGEWTASTWRDFSGVTAVITGLVEANRGNPGLLAWYINDERSEGYLDQIKSTYSLIKSLDSDHPCFQVLWGIQDYAAHVELSDVAGIDCYPVWQKYRDNAGAPYMPIFGSQTRVASKVGMYSRPVWMVGEAGKFPVTPTSVAPTAQQMLCEAYQAIINGARGIMFYNLPNVKADGETQWTALQTAAQNLKAITPIVLGEDVPNDQKVTSSNPNIECITRRVGEDVYILAVNTSTSTITASLNVPEKLASVEGHSVDSGVPGSVTKIILMSGNILADSISVNGTKVYKLTKTLFDRLQESPKPKYKQGHTLPRLMRWGYGIPLDLNLEFVKNWNYALGIGTEDVQISGLDDPNTQWYKLAKIANDNPEIYPVYIYTRFYAYRDEKEGFPESMWCHTDIPGSITTRILKSDGSPVYNPLAPDDVYQTIANKWASGINTLFSKFTNINAQLMVNGGEWGIGVIAGDGEYWKKDPAIISAIPGGVNATREQWLAFISQNKARATKILMDAYLDAIPGSNIGIYYLTSGANLRTYDEPWNWTAWTWDYTNMRSVCGNDLAVMEAYYGTQFTWTGNDNLLNTLLNMVAQQIDDGNPLSYNFVDGGRPGKYSDLSRYFGALKCYFTAGMIGGVAYYDGVTPDIELVNQMKALSHVQSLFSYLETYLREGYLLPGPNMHKRSTDLPAYEFPTGDSSMRVMVRKLYKYDNWLITAWAADGATRDTTVTVPILGTITISGRPEGSVYTAWQENGVPKTLLLDIDGMNPSAEVKDTMLTTAAPIFSPIAGSYGSPRNVVISCHTPDSTVYYTTDGSTPTINSVKYVSPISVTSTTTIKAIAVKSGFNNSKIINSEYKIENSLPFNDIVASWDFSVTGKNLLNQEISNGSESSNISPWNSANGTGTLISSSSDQAHQGNRSIKVEVGNETGGLIFKNVAILDSASYSLSFWIYGPPQDYKLTWTASSNDGVSTKYSSTTLTKKITGWEYFSIENQLMTANTSITGFTISTIANTVFYIDEIQLEQNSVSTNWENGIDVQYYPPKDGTRYTLTRGGTQEPYGWFDDPVITPTGTIFDGKIDRCSNPVGWWNSVFKVGYYDGVKLNSSSGESFVIALKPSSLPDYGKKAYLFDHIINGTSSGDATTSGFAAWINSDGTVTVAARSKGTIPEDTIQMHTSATQIVEAGKWVVIGGSVSFATDGTGEISIFKNGIIANPADQTNNKTFGSSVYIKGNVTPHSPGYLDTIGVASDRSSPFNGTMLYLSLYTKAKNQIEHNDAYQYYKEQAATRYSQSIP